jgi:Skp family chaperone for outer membrane proteins
MKTLKFLPLLNLCILLAGIIFLVMKPNDVQKQYGYVDNIVLFNQFNMAKDLHAMGLPQLNAQKKKVDSLYQLLQTQEDPKLIKEYKQRMYIQNNHLQKMDTELKQEINIKAWERLNSYLEEFGKQQKVNLIFGIQGAGNVMYADKAFDLTQQASEFANLKYEGNK